MKKKCLQDFEDKVAITFIFSHYLLKNKKKIS